MMMMMIMIIIIIIMPMYNSEVLPHSFLQNRS